MKPTRRLMLEALNVSGRSPAAAAPVASDAEWARMLDWLDLSGLSLYLHDRLRRADRLLWLPRHVQAGLDRRAAGNQLRTAGLIDETRTLSSLFRESGVPYGVLKGVALTPDYCPDLELRTQYDHDILIPRTDAAGIGEALVDLGYVRKEAAGACIVYARPMPELRFSETFEALYSPFLGRSVELHLALWEQGQDHVAISLPDDFLDRAVPRWCRGVEYMALSDEDSLLFQVLHAFRHILRNWCRLSVFLEIACFLRSRASDTAFWNRYAGRIENVKWAREASELVFGMAGRLFGAGASPDIAPLLATRLSPVLKLWIAAYGVRAALSNFHADKSVLFLYREFVESAAAWKQVRRRRLLPVRRPHRPPPIVFQRGRSNLGRIWMEDVHALGRLWFHAAAGLGYLLEHPRWTMLRESCLAEGAHPPDSRRL